jgi:hypothetical protein
MSSTSLLESCPAATLAQAHAAVAGALPDREADDSVAAMSSFPSALRAVVIGANALICAVGVSCMPSDFDALSKASEGNGIHAPDACTPGGLDAASSAACGAPAPTPTPVTDARVCGTCQIGQSCEPCPDATVCTDCGDATAADVATPSCGADGEDCELDAEVCENCGEPPATDASAADAAASGCLAPTRECEGGDVESETVPCGACNTGNQTRTRCCDATTCVWSTWSEFGACTGVTAACTPQQTTACANGDSCGHRVCTDSCTWGACQPISAGGCLRIRAGHTDMGSNFRCCGVGHWQFCLPNCTWSAQCDPCAEGAPNYCSECYPNGSPGKDGPDGTTAL